MNDNNEGTNPSNDNANIEWWRLGLDALKWVIGGVVVITGFLMIRPHEQERLDKALQLEVYKAYLSASDTTNIELWQRKLNLMKAFTGDNDNKIIAFIKAEQTRIDDINKSKSALAMANREYDKLKIDREKLKAINSRDKNKLAEANSKLTELNAKLNHLDAQKKTYTEKLTSYGIVNANVTLSSVGSSTNSKSHYVEPGYVEPGYIQEPAVEQTNKTGQK